MNHPLWRCLKRFIETGVETPKVDLKLLLNLESRSNKAEFAKDVTAIANTPGGDGHLILGVKDQKDRGGNDPADYIPGFSALVGVDAFHIQMIDALTLFCNRVPTVEYDEFKHPDCGRVIGVVTIRRSTRRPHSLIRSSGSFTQNQIWIRRGTAAYLASVEEIEVMMGKVKSLPPTTVINLSGHPLTPEQIAVIQEKVYIEELIDVHPHFNPNRELENQIDEVLDAIGLTLEEWQGKQILMGLPGLVPPASALLAAVHGLRGGFPQVIWLVRHPGEDIFSLQDLIQLQEYRDKARTRRVESDPC